MKMRRIVAPYHIVYFLPLPRDDDPASMPRLHLIRTERWEQGGGVLFAPPTDSLATAASLDSLTDLLPCVEFLFKVVIVGLAGTFKTFAG